MPTFSEAQSTIEELLADQERTFRNAFLGMIREVRETIDLEEIIALLQTGSFEDILNRLEDAAVIALGNANATAFAASVESTRRFIQDNLNIVIDFEQVNTRALFANQQHNARMVTNVVESQRRAITGIVNEGIRTGTNPRQTAIAIRDTVGLADVDARAVSNFRRSLEEGSSNYFNYQRRDRRFDSTVRGFLQGDRVLTQEQIDRMVERYYERRLALRAERIARTEAQRSLSEGRNATWDQAIADGHVNPSQLTEEWLTASDARVRDNHLSMNGQTINRGQMFIDGAGNQLRYPGDWMAPPETTVFCRCTVIHHVDFLTDG